MARVVLSGELARRFTRGLTEIEIEAADVRRLISALETFFPGLGEELASPAMAVAIDGEIFQDPFLEPIGAQSEVYFLPAIRGGG